MGYLEKGENFNTLSKFRNEYDHLLILKIYENITEFTMESIFTNLIHLLAYSLVISSHLSSDLMGHPALLFDSCMSSTQYKICNLITFPCGFMNWNLTILSLHNTPLVMYLLFLVYILKIISKINNIKKK